MRLKSSDPAVRAMIARAESRTCFGIPHGMVRCRHCGKTIGGTGLKNHEARCKKASRAQCHDDRDTMTITLPLPPKALSPNARVHWAGKAKVVRDYRFLSAYRTELACYVFVLAGKPRRPLWTRATLLFTFYHAQKRVRDDDNLIASMKAARDGLVDSGLLADDRGLTTLPVKQFIDRDRPRVELTLTSQTGD